jgi:RimJ/RimL family protein N-acetyltransferase
MAHPYWPLFDLVVRTPRLELRHPDDAMCLALADAASPEMFPEGENQFHLDWVFEPPPARQRHSMQWWWRTRASFTAEEWHLTLAVLLDGEPVGCQDLRAARFPALRSITTGSWLARPVQGGGLGKEMRLAAIHLAFDGLGALEAHSSAFVTNARSIAVSRSLGYEDNGERIDMRGSVPSRSLLFRMSRERFEAARRDDVVIENLAPCLPLFGLDETPQPSVR